MTAADLDAAWDGRDGISPATHGALRVAEKTAQGW
jgi:hypothetical protein